MSLGSLPGNGASRAQHPILYLSIGAGSPDDWVDRVVAIRVRAGMAPAADEAIIRLNPGDRPAVGDALILALGYEGGGGDWASALGAVGGGSGGPTQVFAGTVTSVEPTLAGVQVRARNGGAKLQALRIDQLYESQSAGDIVRDLASQAGVTAGAIESGVTLPAYVIDGRRHAYQHVAALARMCGFDAYLTPEDELVFGPFTRTAADHTFAYAEDILSLDVDEAVPAVGQVIVMGESPSSGEGSETWHWLASDWGDYQGAAGDGEPVWLVQARGARTQEAAQAMADGLLDRATRGAIRGILRALGRPEVKVGDAVEVTGAPDEALNRLYQIIGVRHRLDRARGFLTTLEIITADSS
ncbi:MAG TPA: hypothetical protein G4O02_06445 [Caldilineae bacterium]|nr:hypothetical protein [Caldilineae bacterium]